MKPQKPLCALRDDEKIIGIGGSKQHLNPNSRSFAKKSKTPTEKTENGKGKDKWTKLIGL